jgi:hypothetical protein
MAILESFFDRVRQTNPFTDNRVNGPAPAGIDVDQVHQGPFDRLVALAREAWVEERGLGAVVWGEAGVGKSHVISRLSHWAEQDKHACLVYLHNLQASPENLPRSILKSVVSVLTRGRARQFHQTPLYRIVNATVAHALEKHQPGTPTWSRAEKAYASLVDGLSAASPARAALIDRTVYEVVFRFFRSDLLAWEGKEDGTLAELAVRWLAGDFLDPAEARQLGLPPAAGTDEAVALVDNQQIKQVMVALTQLAWYRKQPFVLCFDQVDNLETEQVATLARFLEAIIDSSPNLLVVTSGVQATLMGWLNDKVIQASAWDRLAQFEIGLQRVTPQQAGRIVAARLNQFMVPFLEADEAKHRVQEDHYFPLGARWFQTDLAGRIAVRPRDALNWAREAWRREQDALARLGGPAWLAQWGATQREDRHEPVRVPLTPERIDQAIDHLLDQKIREHKAERLRNQETLPPDAGNLSGLVHALLAQCLQEGVSRTLVGVDRPPPLKSGQKRAYDLIVQQRVNQGSETVRTALLFLATKSTNSTTRSLRRMLRDRNPPDRVLLITDQRLPISLGIKGDEYYEQLKQKGTSRFQHIELPIEHYSELDALQAAIGLARAGDLEIDMPDGEGRPVSEREVIASHNRRQRYRSAPLLADLLADHAPTDKG